MAPQKRMTADERKHSIINAAKPLFAQKGFNGTSIRNIATAANTSEALLYKHFSGKEEMYQEILSYAGRLSNKTYKELEILEPSTKTLVLITYALFRVIVFKIEGKENEQTTHERLLFYSLLENVSYAKLVFNDLLNRFSEMFATSLEKAEENGDLTGAIGHKTNRFWFLHHMAMAINLCHISGEPAFPYDGSLSDLVDEAARFSLQGLGLTDKAIETYFDAKKLDEYLVSDRKP